MSSPPFRARRSAVEVDQEARDVESCRQVFDEEVIVQRPLRASVTDEEDRVIDLVAKVYQRLHNNQARTVIAGVAPDQDLSS